MTDAVDGETRSEHTVPTNARSERLQDGSSPHLIAGDDLVSDESGDTGLTSFDEARFREVLGHFPTGIAIVTALEDGQPVGFTCQTFISLSLDPPLVALAPAKTSTSWPKIARAGAFCVNVLAEHQEALCRSFAISGGDKFAGVGWRQGLSGAPILDDVLAWVECELGVIHDAGDHELVTGRVRAMDVGQGAPLLFYRGGFARLAR